VSTVLAVNGIRQRVRESALVSKIDWRITFPENTALVDGERRAVASSGISYGWLEISRISRNVILWTLIDLLRSIFCLSKLRDGRTNTARS
jgi:hypothetical protein